MHKTEIHCGPLTTQHLHKHLIRLKQSKAARNVAASYVAFASTTITGLISIPLAVHFLTMQELGLWAVITVVTGYLGFMELGIGPATGRKMADAIVAKDKAEIDRWWTLTRVVLSLQGVIVILIGLALTPVFMSGMAAEFPDRKQALYLIIAMVVITGIKFPFLGAEGVLTAQQRFHWVPLRQAFVFWVELAVLAACLFYGLGLYAVLWSKASMLIAIWILNWILLSKSEPKLGWDTTGLRWDRFRILFGYSLNVSGVQLFDALVKSLPVMVLGKIGGLAAIPVYSISIKISTVLVSIGKRNYQSFYPAVLKMFIEGNHENFRTQFNNLSLMTLATGLAVAGFILCINRMGVELLSTPEFYAGTIATTWFAVSTITMPVCGLMYMTLLAAGKLGKSALVAAIRAIASLFLFVLAYRSFGIDGLAAVMSLLPLVMGAYCYFRGAAEAGCTPRKLFGSIATWTLAGMLVVFSGGMIIHWVPSDPLFLFAIATKTVATPSLVELFVGGCISLTGMTLFVFSLNRLRKKI